MLLTGADVALKKRLVHVFGAKQASNYMQGIESFGSLNVLLILDRNY